jgi:hypothetical protein
MNASEETKRTQTEREEQAIALLHRGDGHRPYRPDLGVCGLDAQSPASQHLRDGAGAIDHLRQRLNPARCYDSPVQNQEESPMLRSTCVAAIAAALVLPLFAATEQAAGVYYLSAVNGHSVPAVSWKNAGTGKECVQETVAATLLLDSAGQWSALMTTRDRCKGEPAPKRGEGTSTLFSGPYDVSGELIVMQSELSGEMRGTISADEITILVNGAAQHVGQTATYIFKRARR